MLYTYTMKVYWCYTIIELTVKVGKVIIQWKAISIPKTTLLYDSNFITQVPTASYQKRIPSSMKVYWSRYCRTTWPVGQFAPECLMRTIIGGILYALVALLVQHMTNCHSTSGSLVFGLAHPRTTWRTRNQSTWPSACFPIVRFRILYPGAWCFFGADNPRPRITVCGGHGAFDREKIESTQQNNVSVVSLVCIGEGP